MYTQGLSYQNYRSKYMGAAIDVYVYSVDCDFELYVNHYEYDATRESLIVSSVKPIVDNNFRGGVGFH